MTKPQFQVVKITWYEKADSRVQEKSKEYFYEYDGSPSRAKLHELNAAKLCSDKTGKTLFLLSSFFYDTQPANWPQKTETA